MLHLKKSSGRHPTIEPDYLCSSFISLEEWYIIIKHCRTTHEGGEGRTEGMHAIWCCEESNWNYSKLNLAILCWSMQYYDHLNKRIINGGMKENMERISVHKTTIGIFFRRLSWGDLKKRVISWFGAQIEELRHKEYAIRLNKGEHHRLAFSSGGAIANRFLH